MGRLQRKRKRKWRMETILENDGGDFIQLMHWLRDQDCSLPDHIQWGYFNDTGRGLRTTIYLQKNCLLVSLPKHLMITIHTVMQSCIGWWFLNADDAECFSIQEILAVFLVWEKHLGSSSLWAPYINYLPRKYTTPLTLSKTEKIFLPKYVCDRVQEQERTVSKAYSHLVATVRKISSLCEHCGKALLADVFSFKSFVWAWITVNTRAVYVMQTASAIKLRGDNTLALAPFLDLFNHSSFTATTVEETADVYNLFSSDSWSANNQVFISYGPHANCKLYVEYGFVVFNNPQDVVPVTVQEIDEVMNSVCTTGNTLFYKARNELIQQNKLTENLFFSNEEPSFTLKAYIFVMQVSDFDKKVLQQKIFSDEFTVVEKKIINRVITELLCNKITEFQQQMSSMLALSHCSQSFGTAITLVNYHLQLLERVYTNIFK